MLLRETLYHNWWHPILRGNVSDPKDYFGARVARHLICLSFYAKNLPSLAILAVAGTALFNFLIGARSSRFANRFRGRSVFLEPHLSDHWNRMNAMLNVLWGLGDFYEDVQNGIRPAVRGVETKGFCCEGGFVNLQNVAPRGRDVCRVAQRCLW